MAAFIRYHDGFDGTPKRFASWDDGSVTGGKLGLVIATSRIACELTPAQQAMELADILGLCERSEFKAAERHYKAAIRSVTISRTGSAREQWVLARLAGFRRVSTNARHSCFAWRKA
jgi:hypothetical protein